MKMLTIEYVAACDAERAAKALNTLAEEDIYIQPEGTLADYIAAVDQAMERDESYLPNT